MGRVTDCRLVNINGRWPLWLPTHRAARPEWPWWEATRLAAMHHVLGGGGGVVWDVGAEEGDFPALWASWGNQVVLAEPNPRVWPNIRRIWEANALPPPVAAWCGFLGDEQHHVTPGPVLDGSWPACADGPLIGDHGFCQLGERPDLPCTTVDHLVGLGLPAPTAVTMDVEGAEMHVLRGARTTLEWYRPQVFVSVHPEFMEHHYGTPDGVQLVRQWMHLRGYPLDRQVFLGVDHEHHWWFRP